MNTVTRRVTLQVLATDLGVSRATVSNAYNRPDQLSGALRERILARAGELGFAGPDPVARGLRRGRVGAVGVLVDQSLSYAFSDPVAVLVLDGLAHELQDEGYGLLLHAAGPGQTDVEHIRSAAVDGWVVMSIPLGHPAVGAAHQQGRPLVVIDQPAVPGAPLLALDDAGGAASAADHLLELGHRRIGVLTAPLKGDGPSGPADLGRQAAATNLVMSTRLAAVARTLTAAGVAWPGVPVVECTANSEDAGAAGAAELLDLAGPPTAVLALTDQLALGVLRLARDRGVSVPADLSVVGFDDTPPARTSSPGLTTVAQALPDRGAAAGRLLRGLLNGDRIEAPATFGTRLVVRASTAPPRPL